MREAKLITGVDNVAIAVSDLSSMAAFFEDRLACRVSRDPDVTPPAAIVELGEQRLYLTQTGDQGAVRPPRSTSTSRNAPGFDHLSLRVADLGAEVERLGQRGLEFETKPETLEEWGVALAAFRDPEGNLYYLIEHLSWT